MRELLIPRSFRDASIDLILKTQISLELREQWAAPRLIFLSYRSAVQSQSNILTPV